MDDTIISRQTTKWTDGQTKWMNREQKGCITDKMDSQIKNQQIEKLKLVNP